MNKRTKALAIPKKVKEAVYRRDKGQCVLCGSYHGLPCAHVIRRSQGGLGIEKNIVTLCNHCHYAFDEGKHRAELYERIKAYMKGIYPDWNEEKLIYKKY